MSSKPGKFIFEPFDLPKFDVPQVEHLPSVMTWDDAMRETESLRQYYLTHHDSPEKRLRDKNPERFRME